MYLLVLVLMIFVTPMQTARALELLELRAGAYVEAALQAEGDDDAERFDVRATDVHDPTGTLGLGSRREIIRYAAPGLGVIDFSFGSVFGDRAGADVATGDLGANAGLGAGHVGGMAGAAEGGRRRPCRWLCLPAPCPPPPPLSQCPSCLETAQVAVVGMVGGVKLPAPDLSWDDGEISWGRDEAAATDPIVAAGYPVGSPTYPMSFDIDMGARGASLFDSW